MSEASFTPGPWEAMKGVDPSDDMRCGVGAVRGDLRYLVATIENGAPGDICDTEFANAHLIAAAPELYEELDHLVEIIDGTEETGFDASVEQMLMDAADVARKLLAKARGETL